jgi:hypothetical protein
MNTPEFLVWAIEYTCPVRGFQNGSNPERTERQLRAARAVSDARREGRVFEGLCVKPPDGFRIDEALEVYGGLAAVQQACSACPANAMLRSEASALAGCFGVVPLPVDESQMHAAVERAIDCTGAADDVTRLFQATRPCWYGLWMHSPLNAEQAAAIEKLMANVAVAETDRKWQTEFNSLANLLMGLQTVQQAGLRLHHALNPRGTVSDKRWRLVPHCSRCRAPWDAANARQCSVCGQAASRAPDKKRHARGNRPYFPLYRLLGPEQAAALLIRYEAFGALPGSPDREQTPLPEVQLDSPPGG